jgi:hypothetical protein
MLSDHYGHKIVIARYGNANGNTYHYSIECENCFEVLAEDRMLDLPDQTLTEVSE